MIIVLGPPGAGKGVQSKLIASNLGYEAMSVGQLLRDSSDKGIAETQNRGELVSDDVIKDVLGKALDIRNRAKLIIDGFPRDLGQAKWLVDTYSSDLDLLLIIDVSKSELLKRLKLRARADDTKNAILKRLEIYNDSIGSIMNYFQSNDIEVLYIDGNGAIDTIHEDIRNNLESRGLI